MTGRSSDFTVTVGATDTPQKPAPDPQLIDQEKILAKEQKRIWQRRTASGVAGHYRNPPPSVVASNPNAITDTVGLALSGGGIRSATVSLGMLRVLGTTGLIPRIDYISSVSGGSYIAAYLCSRYVPTKWRGDTVLDREKKVVTSGDDVFAGADGQEGLNHLRQSGRHLLPGGAGDWIKLVALMLRNWLAIHLVIGVTLVTVLLLIKVPQALWDRFGLDAEQWMASVAGLPPDLWPSMWMHGYPVSHWVIASWILPLALLPLTIVLALFWAYFLTRAQPPPGAGRWRRAIGAPGLHGAVLICLGAAILSLMRPASPDVAWARVAAVAVALFAALTMLCYVLAEMVEAGSTNAELPDKLKLPGFLRRPMQWLRAKALPAATASARVQEDRVRTRLTNAATWFLSVTLVIAALGLVDSLALTMVVRGDEMTYPPRLAAALAAMVPIARQLILRVGQKRPAKGEIGKIVARFGHVIALVVGLIVATLVGTFWAIIAHRVAWFDAPVGMVEDSLWFNPWISFALTIAAAVALTVLIANAFSFLNLSSFAGFYSSNLRRAYLGASNTSRWAGRDRWSVNKDHVDDDIALEAYYDDRLRPPLHLINCTINDTASHASNLTQRDRRGKPLVISPAGYLFPADDLRGTLHGIPFARLAPPRDPLLKRARQTVKRVAAGLKGLVGRAGGSTSPAVAAAAGPASGKGRPATPEALPLSAWIGISGAAASTGVGQYGSLGLSLLAGLAGVRLGYWWDPGLASTRNKTQAGRQNSGKTKRKRRFGRAIQCRLIDEFFSHFEGTDGERWYLSDGGHFENTGAYELIRRRVALIVVLDNGADPAYEFADLAVLVRRVRIDFDADISFETSTDELDRLFGGDDPRTPNHLRRAFAPIKSLGLVAGDSNPAIGPYAAIGKITYGANSPPGVDKRQASTIIWIKPRVCGAEAPDLLAYARSNPPFPQESTLDQNFSEAQWESYYRLGTIMGEQLFAATAGGAWDPRDLRSAF